MQTCKRRVFCIYTMAINCVPFNKPASSPEQLLQKLERQGLVVDDARREWALSYMRFVGGYRLKGYWYHLVDPVTKAFPAGHRFEQIVSRCEFDRELRALTMAAIERLEIAVRVVMANYLMWYLNKVSKFYVSNPSKYVTTEKSGINKVGKFSKCLSGTGMISCK